MFFFQEGFTYRNFLLDVLTVFFLYRVVLVAHYCCFRSVPTPRHLRLGQGNMGDRMDRISIHFHACILDLSGKGHGGT